MHLISRRLLYFKYTDVRLCQRCRGLSISVSVSSGHSRWSKIKHDKGKEDAIKSKQCSILAQELRQASKRVLRAADIPSLRLILTMSGMSTESGADPDTNPRLAQAVVAAKKAGYPKSSIEAAIARGQGVSSSGAALETLTLEAIMPTSVATVIDCQTDSKARTLSAVRHLIRDYGGTVTPTSYLFEKKGKIVFERAEGLSVYEVLDEAVEAGAMDIEEDEQGRLVVYTEPSQTKSAAEGLTTAKGLKVESSDIIWDPNQDTMVELNSERDVQNLDNFLQAVHEEPSVQNVYLNVA